MKREEIDPFLSDVNSFDEERPYLTCSDQKTVIQMPLLEEAIVNDEYEDADDHERRKVIFSQLDDVLTAYEDILDAGRVDPELPTKLRRSLPAAGSNVANVEIHMRHIFNHVVGRRKSETGGQIPGLYAFASRVTKLINGYNEGCPYAAWQLVNIENKIKECGVELKRRAIAADKAVEELELGINYEPFESRKPAIETLTFFSPYAAQTAAILMQYDKLLRDLFPYRQMQFIDMAEFEKLGTNFGSDVRSLLQTGEAWFYVGAEAVRAKDETYLAAEARMGEVPVEFLTKKIAPKWVPARGD